MNARPDPFDAIVARLESLEHRVQALERSHGEVPLAPDASVPAEAPVASWPEPLPQFTSAFPALGGSLLGIAGAYLLRAVSGANLLPRTVVALMAALYAGAWLFAASRAAMRQKFAGALYAAVSILILAPMLWEMTIRFSAMRGTTAAAILALYAAAAALLGLRRSGILVFSVAFAGSAIAAAALSIGTHRMTEFTYLLLAMLLACEWAEQKLHLRTIRILVALAADVGVWTLLLVYRLAPADRADYPASSTALVAATAVVLFALELAAVARKAMVQDQPLPALAVVQAVIAFGIAAAGIAWLAPGAAGLVLGILCLILAAACYAAAYGPVRLSGPRRNFHILSIWALCLVLGAAFTLARLPAASIAIAIAAVAAILLANRISSLALELHGVLFLLVAAGFSGLAAWSAHALAGALPANPPAAVLAVAACAVTAYAVAGERAAEDWRQQALHLAPALLAAFAVAAILAIALLNLARQFLAPEAFHLALIRTLALCSLAMTMAYAGARLGRPAMVRTAYTALAFVAAKLVFEDLLHGRLEFTAASIFALAVSLIAMPRLTRSRARDAVAGK